MNKIIISESNIEQKNLDANIELKETNKDEIKTIKLDVLKSTSLTIIYNRAKKTKLNIEININKDVFLDIIDIKTNGKYKLIYKYNLEENSKLNIVKINDVKETKETQIINLNKQNAKVNYILKTVAKEEEKYDLMIYHNAKNTQSNIINHGVNIEDGKIKFDVSSFVPNKIKNCVVDQNNRIINLTNNKCEIWPNLFIDEYDVIANHSAHIGKCNEEKLFYLKSRGINEKDAESLLIKGFLMQKLNTQKDTMENIIKKYWR